MVRWPRLKCNCGSPRCIYAPRMLSNMLDPSRMNSQQSGYILPCCDKNRVGECDMITIEQLIEEYVDDLNAGVFPRVYEHMESNPHYEWEAVLPLLEFIT